MKKFLILLVAGILFLVGGGIVYFYHGLRIETSLIYIANMQLKADMVEITGDTVNSSIAYCGYDYEVKDKALYISLRYSIVNFINGIGTFDIKIPCKTNEIKRFLLEEVRMRI